MSDESDAYDSYESDSFGFVSDYEQYGNKEEKTSAAQVSVDKTIISDQMKSAVIAMDNERATIVQVPPMMDRDGAEEEAEFDLAAKMIDLSTDSSCPGPAPYTSSQWLSRPRRPRSTLVLGWGGLPRPTCIRWMKRIIQQ
ncbi:Zinc finger C3H1-type [Carpediemonas membranifera]|uniref:Zinc finger C3H1-type n=1 Tax=Carpediemonas membranifera TaxID=201153 RepID=A0A8J6ATG7_9EUKA|nr:Zinc finger C3H1-type [Carpediemonas membranifera]|eukprot:KAG9391985.1 Zinc finger C3H1-type [Carpediemonas membranifera]